MLKVEVKKGSISEVDVEAVVNPANSLGYMGGGVAGYLKRVGGKEIEEETIRKAPIPIGKPILTGAGKLPFKAIIHSPTMEEPAMRTDQERVRKAVRGALELADKEGFTSIAFPGMGTGVGGLSKSLCAKIMVEEVKNFKPKNLKKVVFVDIDEEMVLEWKKLLE